VQQRIDDQYAEDQRSDDTCVGDEDMGYEWQVDQRPDEAKQPCKNDAAFDTLEQQIPNGVECRRRKDESEGSHED
jgi:hypothetical protein